VSPRIESGTRKNCEERGGVDGMDNIQKLTYNHNKSATKKKTMMICEDEPDIRLLFGLVFGSKYDIILVDSGEDCTERFIEEKNRENKIHLILLDYKLGGMLGDSVARKIKEYSGTKIILNSAYNIADVPVKELENGNYISKYLQKPFEINRLTDLVGEIV